MELTPLSAGLAGAIAMFALQLLLCLKAKRLAVRLIPVYLIVAALLCGAATFLGVFGTYSAGAISGNELAGLFLLALTGIAATGSALAWLVFGISKLVGRKKEGAPEAGGEARDSRRTISPALKKAALAMLAAVVVIGSAVYLSPSLRAKSFVALHGDDIEYAVEAGHGVPAWLGDYDYNSWEKGAILAYRKPASRRSKRRDGYRLAAS